MFIDLNIRYVYTIPQVASSVLKRCIPDGVTGDKNETEARIQEQKKTLNLIAKNYDKIKAFLSE